MEFKGTREITYRDWNGNEIIFDGPTNTGGSVTLTPRKAGDPDDFFVKWDQLSPDAQEILKELIEESRQALIKLKEIVLQDALKTGISKEYKADW